jgi:hypothetical protein
MLLESRDAPGKHPAKEMAKNRYVPRVEEPETEFANFAAVQRPYGYQFLEIQQVPAMFCRARRSRM